MSVTSLQNLPFYMEQWSGNFQDWGITGYETYQQTRFNAFMEETQDITITTEEGDKVTISSLEAFEADYMDFDYSGSLSQQTVSMEAEELNVSSKYAFSVTVEGDLNEEEQADIEKVLARLDDIMTDLISGDIESVMAEALGIIDDTESISSLNAVLKFQQSISVEQQTVTQMIGQSLPGQQSGELPTELSTENGIFNSDFIEAIKNKLMDIIESSAVDMEKLKDPVQGYFSNLLEQLSMEKGEGNILTSFIDQLNTALEQYFKN